MEIGERVESVENVNDFVEGIIMILQYVLSGSTLAAVGVVISFTIKALHGTRAMLRSEIVRLYYAHQADRKMPEYDYSSLVDLFAQYKSLGGNGFVTKIYNEMINEWKVTPRDE